METRLAWNNKNDREVDTDDKFFCWVQWGFWGARWHPMQERSHLALNLGQRERGQTARCWSITVGRAEHPEIFITYCHEAGLHHTVVLTVAASQPLIGPQEMLILSCPGKEGSCSPQVRISLCNPLILLFFCFFLSSTYKYFLAFLKNQALALLNFYQPNLFHKKKKWSKKNKRWRN